MWTQEGIRKTGHRHLARGLACQDQIDYGIRGQKQAIALVDGRGETDVNARFGQEVCQYINDFLLTYYKNIAKAEALMVSYNFFYHLHEMMEQKCQEENVDRKELSSTILGICIDHETESYCAIHLGDGMILGEKEDGERIYLSQPQNGPKSNETILSTAEYAMKHLRIEKGSLKNIKKIAMTSDGIGEDSQMIHEFIFSDYLKNDTISSGIDDISMIRLGKES